jgi:hypothetical protein
MPGRALGFGMVAEAYERFRLGYPAELFDVVMAYAGRPVRTQCRGLWVFDRLWVVPVFDYCG